jgi:hypothetical protein
VLAVGLMIRGDHTSRASTAGAAATEETMMARALRKEMDMVVFIVVAVDVRIRCFERLPRCDGRTSPRTCCFYILPSEAANVSTDPAGTDAGRGGPSSQLARPVMPEI